MMLLQLLCSLMVVLCSASCCSLGTKLLTMYVSPAGIMVGGFRMMRIRFHP